MPLESLPELIVRPFVENALREDLGRAGDITSNAIIPSGLVASAQLNSRQAGVVAGLDIARLAFQVFDSRVVFTHQKNDGDKMAAGDCLATITGPASSLLAAERVALNYLCRLSGIATQTNVLVESVRPHKARVCCTRKTTPNLRALEKYAVRAGGGYNHRFGLDDAVLIKDNHIAVAGGVKIAIERVRKTLGHLVKVEIEVDQLAQLEETLALLPYYPVDVVLLDNMKLDMLREAVAMVAAKGNGRILVEASGGVTRETIGAIAATGVDIISVGWITHSSPIVDIGLDI